MSQFDPKAERSPDPRLVDSKKNWEARLGRLAEEVSRSGIARPTTNYFRQVRRIAGS
jgi:hypothetical protein